MDVCVRYLQADPKTGMLRFRRVFPERLRRHVVENGRPLVELKVTLRARSISEPGAMRRYEDAKAKYDRLLSHAQKIADRKYE